MIELLVVVAIVMLLAALLFPALNRARDSAVTVQCVSNLRQWGLGLEMFIVDNGRYPVISWNGGWQGWIDEVRPNLLRGQPAWVDANGFSAIHGDVELISRNAGLFCPMWTKVTASPETLGPPQVPIDFLGTTHGHYWEAGKRPYNGGVYLLNGYVGAAGFYNPNACLRPGSVNHPTEMALLADGAHYGNAQNMFNEGNYPALYDSTYPWHHFCYRHHSGHAVNVSYADGHVGQFKQSDVPGQYSVAYFRFFYGHDSWPF